MLPLLVDADVLVNYLDDPRVKIVDLTRVAVYQQVHLPKAIHVQPKQLVQPIELASGFLPSLTQMQDLVEYLHLAPTDHVVAYDDEGGAWASRLLWNLHCIGFLNTSLLNGGIQTWLNGKFPISHQVHQPIIPQQYFQPSFNTLAQYKIDYQTLKKQVQEQSIQIWDCRSLEEYTGQKRTARLAGHIPNARHYEANTAICTKNHLRLYPLDQIKQQLQQVGFDLTKPVVVYCQSHHRSALAYIIGRLLNWQVMAYDGAWSEWGNCLHSPTVMGEKPL